ncbi:hypothetical protein PM082_002186 [Marasmius tenuissimus]|nr:hypothetical protein PM082_002186 [Marasmius tenuissimus]
MAHTAPTIPSTIFYNKTIRKPMKAIELVTGVKTDCWRPPEGDVDDRIRAIAKGLGLKTILWKYDSQDWQVKAGTATPEQVDGNYQHFIDAAKNGTFDKEGAILLQHENNNYTMSEAMKWYPAMKEAFKNVVPVRVALASDYVPPPNSGNETTSAGSSASSPVQPPASAASGFTSLPATQTTTGGPNTPTGNTTSSGNTSTGSNGAYAFTIAPSALLGLAVISLSALIL